jgi:hypothetical protein
MTDTLYIDESFPERHCDFCHRLYRGPTHFCSVECASMAYGALVVQAIGELDEK